MRFSAAFFVTVALLLDGRVPAFSQNVDRPAFNGQPKAGEVALTGQIESLDVSHNCLLLRVNSFTNPQGKTAILATPKLKTISLSLETPIVNQSNGKIASFGDLGKGEEITAIGTDVGKLLRARIVGWQAHEVIERDQDSPAEAVPFLPAPQMAFTANFRPIDVRWGRPKDISPNFRSGMPAFYTLWKLRAEAPTGTDENNYPLQKSTLARLIQVRGPGGEPLDATIASTAIPVTGDSTFTLFGDNIDPKWPFVTYEWEIRDPASSTAEAGQFSSLLEWKDLDFPTQVGQKIEVGKDVISTNGTVIRLLSVERRPALAGREGEYLYFSFRATKNPKIPDIEVRLAMDDLVGVGGSYKGNSWGGGSSGDEFNVRTGMIPPADAGKLTLRVRLTENAASLQDRSKYKRLKFQIPVTPVWRAHPVETRRIVAPSAETANLRVQLEGLQKSGNDITGTFWIENKIPDGKETTYFLRQVSFQKANGQKVTTTPWADQENRRRVREDGTIASSQSRSQDFYLSGSSPGPLDLALRFEQGRRFQHRGTLRDIPLPAQDENRRVNEDALADDFFAVRRVVRYSDSKVFEGLPEKWRGNLKAGVAIVVEISPLLPDAEISFQVRSIFDNNGRQWGGTNGFNSFSGDATIARMENTRFRTIFLPNFDANSKTICLDMTMVETLWTGIKDTATLHLP